MPDLVDLSESMGETIILHRWAFGGQAATLDELRANYSPGQETYVYLAGKNVYTWDASTADFVLVGQWQGRSLEFAWDGTRLGIRREGDTTYTYSDLSSSVDLTPITTALAAKADKADLDAPTEKVQALGNKSGTVAINAANGNIATLTATGALTITLTASAASGYGRVLTLIMTNAGNYAVMWPSSVKWADGTAPTLTASGTDIVTLVTTDNGATWRGMLSGGGYSA